MSFQAKTSPDQLETKINKNIVLMKRTQGPYSSPILVLFISSSLHLIDLINRFSYIPLMRFFNSL